MSLHVFRFGIKPLVFLFAFISLLTMAVKVAPAAEYHNNKSLSRHLASLAEQNPELVRVDGIARSIAKRRVWLVELGKGAEQDRKTRPAMLVVAGIEGNDLVGSSIAVSWIKHLIEQYETDAEITELLQTTTFYVVPRLNPDAAEHFFNEPKCETSRNDKPVDDDHDGLMDEDGPEDLNGDGLITSMRIEDPEGEYILDPNDDRLLIKADPLKSEVGAWRYLTEGIDNDHDELWNEDGPGGVNFNRNFPYNFEFFASDAGVHQVSEPETRALADFVIEHPNIGIIMTYGAADNLLKTPKSAPPPDRRKPMNGIDEDDASYYRVIGELYRKALGLSKELEDTSCPGTFSDWMYFHRGRLSLAAKPWSPELAVELSKAAEKKAQAEDEKDAESELEDEKKDKDKKPKDDDDRNAKEREELKWFDEHAPQSFVKWQAIEHPDFPNQRVEVGGYSPFAFTNPPVEMIEQIAAKHADFLTIVAQRLPRIGIRKIETRHLGRSVYEVKIQVENTGFLPTSISQGQTAREVYPTRLIIELDNIFFLSGTRITNIPLILGSGGMEEVRYIIRSSGRKKINFEVISVLAGQLTGTIELTNAE
jgi:hypothetical protein